MACQVCKTERGACVADGDVGWVGGGRGEFRMGFGAVEGVVGDQVVEVDQCVERWRVSCEKNMVFLLDVRYTEKRLLFLSNDCIESFATLITDSTLLSHRFLFITNAYITHTRHQHMAPKRHTS